MLHMGGILDRARNCKAVEMVKSYECRSIHTNERKSSRVGQANPVSLHAKGTAGFLERGTGAGNACFEELGRSGRRDSTGGLMGSFSV